MKLSLVFLAWLWSLLLIAFLFSGYPPVWQSLQRDIQLSGIKAAHYLQDCESSYGNRKSECQKVMDKYF